MQAGEVHIYDNTIPTQNRYNGQVFNVQIDNENPTNTTPYYVSALHDLHNSPYNNTQVDFAVDIVTDNYKLKKYVFTSNLTGVWLNDTEIALSGVSYEGGVYLKTNFFEAGISGANLLPTALNGENFGITLLPHYTFSSRAFLPVNTQLIIQPGILLRVVSGLLQLDLLS